MADRDRRHLSNEALTLRPVGPGDEAFEVELIGGPLPELQRAAQRREFLRRFPGSQPQIVCQGGALVGRIWVWRAEGATHLVDLVVAPGRRNQGIGTALLRGLLAAGGPVRLSVAAANASALRLYERLGFRRTGGNETHLQLEAEGRNYPAPEPGAAGPIVESSPPRDRCRNHPNEGGVGRAHSP
jgi:ribosomal protein S18 acetylase RimI-like enzyme